MNDAPRPPEVDLPTGICAAEQSHLPFTWSESTRPPAFRRGGNVVKWLSLGLLRLLLSTPLHALTTHSTTRGDRDQRLALPVLTESITTNHGTRATAAHKSTSEGAAAEPRPRRRVDRASRVPRDRGPRCGGSKNALSVKGCDGSFFRPLECARNALDACTFLGCLRHGTTVPIRRVGAHAPCAPTRLGPMHSA